MFVHTHDRIYTDARFEWTQTEELNADPDDVVDVMSGMRALARRAKQTGRAMFLWGSL
jgi:hypothetical protein